MKITPEKVILIAQRIREKGASVTLEWSCPQFAKYCEVIDAKEGIIQLKLEDVWPLI